MPFLPGVLPFPAAQRVVTVGQVVVGALVRFTSAAGKIASSLVTVDGPGNIATPGVAKFGETADGAARVGTSGSGASQYAEVGHSEVGIPGFRQRADGLLTLLHSGAALVGAVSGRITIWVSSDGARVNGSLGANTGPAAGLALHVSGGFFGLPRLTAVERDNLTANTPLNASYAGALCYNTDAARPEMWDGAAWVGFSTTP